VWQYFEGIQTALLASGHNYPIGVYGSGNVCDYMYKNVGNVLYTWMSMSPGWGGHSTYTSWNLKQLSGVTVDGLSCDSDSSNNNAGGWQIFS
jgi:hypothetical protein